MRYKTVRQAVCLLLAALLLLLCGCEKKKSSAPTASAGPAVSDPVPSDEGEKTAAEPRLTVIGLPDDGAEADRTPLALRLCNEGGNLTSLQILLVWRFYDRAGERILLDSLPEDRLEALLGIDEAPEYYGPVVQEETAVLVLPLSELSAGATAELTVPVPGSTAETVRADLFFRTWDANGAQVVSSGWWSYADAEAVLPAWEQSPVLPELRSAGSLAWELRDGTAVLTGIGSWPLSALSVPATVRLSEVPARTVTVQASRVKESALFSGVGKEYWLERSDGSRITDREELTSGNETVSRLLIFNGKTFSKHVLRGTEFPDLTLMTEDGVEIVPANVRDLITAENCSEDAPFVLLLSPKQGTCLIEDPVSGTAYPVLVRGSAFAGCGSLRSVRFSPACGVENGEMKFANSGMFSGCTALESVLSFPMEVVSMESAFLGCTALQTLGNLPEKAVFLRDTFQGCTSLRSVPPLPDSAQNLERCFDGCTALDTPPVLGAGTKDLTECFRGCVSLSEPPVLPEGVEIMARTFYGCTALTRAPELPESVTDLTRCFLGCSALGGEITIPSRPLTPAAVHDLYISFSGCTGLEAVHLQYCGFRSYPGTLPGGVPVTADCTHVEDGLCPYCHYANEEMEIDGIDVIFDAVYEPYYLAAKDYLDNEVPDFLKDSCAQLIFTEDMERYYSDFGLGLKVKEVAGFATSWNGRTCVRTYSSEEVGNVIGYVEHTIVHELAHVYDFNAGDGDRISSSEEWIRLFEQEGETTANYYGPAFRTYPTSQKIIESYAIAVECYIFIPSEFSRVCPGMYAYLEENLPKEE